MPPKAQPVPPKKTHSVELYLRAIVRIDVESETPEEALKLARENAHKWATEGMTAEISDSTVQVSGVTDNAPWGDYDRKVR